MTKIIIFYTQRKFNTIKISLTRYLYLIEEFEIQIYKKLDI